MFADIEKGIEVYKSRREEDKETLVQKLNANIPSDILKAHGEYVKAKKEMKAKEKYLEQNGYYVNNYGDESEVVVNTYRTQPIELTQYDKETEQTANNLEGLKRKFALRLYAGGIEEIQTLFKDLTEELDGAVKAK